MQAQEARGRGEASDNYVAEFCYVHVQLARLRERFHTLQTELAAPCPVCKGLGAIRSAGDCRTCGGKGRILPLFGIGDRLIYQDSLGNLVELDAEGNDTKWPDKIALCED